jgi:hypothetical protein
MRRFLSTALIVVFFSSCLKENKINTVEKSFIWPLQKGNSWYYTGTRGLSDGGSKDTTAMALIIDSSVYIDGNEYFAAQNHYDAWYRSVQGQLFKSNAAGDKISLMARNVSEETVLYEEAGTFHYFEGANAFSGTLTRIAYPQITVIHSYNCARTDDIYKNDAGNIVQKLSVFYSIDKGPICFKYYGNRESPGDSSIYLLSQYIIDSLVIQEF